MGLLRKVLYHSGAGLNAALTLLLSDFRPSLTIVEFPYLFRVVSKVPARLRGKLVLSEQNIEHEMYRSMGNPIWPAVYIVERRAVRNADAVWALCEEDAAGLRKAFKRSDIWTIPIGVEPSKFRRIARSDHTKPSGGGLERQRIVFHGDFSHRPNRWALERLTRIILPEVAKHVPNTLAVVFGRGIDSGIHGRVESLGFVADVPRTIAMCDVAVVPILEPGGVKVKILEYLATGIPVVTTSAGNRGIGLTHAKNGYVSNDLAGEFSLSVVKLLKDSTLRQEIGARGRQFVQEHFPVQRSTKLVVEAVETTLS